MDSNQFTRKKTKKSKTNFYYSFLFLPKKKRDAIFTVYSFCRHTDDIVDDIQSPGEASQKLDKWREELDRCYDGQPHHPITTALHEAAQTFSIPKDYFHALIDGCEMDITRKRYQTFDELQQYCYHVASVVGLICIEIFGYRSPKTKDYAIDLGMALQLTNIMRDVGEDARNGRIYLPIEELEQFNYSEEEILNEIYNDSFIELMRFQEERARGYFNKAIEQYERRDHHLLFPAEIMRKIYFKLLNNVAAIQYNVFNDRVRVPNWEKMMIALQLWLGSRWRRLVQWAPTS